MGRQCRVWWPEQLSSCEPSSHFLLFGWCMYSAFGSLDLVVAMEASLCELPPQLDLKEVLNHVNNRMPASLQSHSTLCVLGHCAIGFSNGNYNAMDGKSNDLSFEDLESKVQYFGMEKGAASKSPDCHRAHGHPDGKGEVSHCITWNCGCYKLNRSLEKYRQSSVRNSNWIQLYSSDRRFLYGKTKWIPDLHHIHCNGQLWPVSHTHLIIYEQPLFGVHHFSSSNWNSFCQPIIPFKKPNWVAELHQKQFTFELDTVILALNCANAANNSLKKCLGSMGSLNQSSTMSMLTTVVLHVVAILMASISTIVYIILQFFYRFFSYASVSFIYKILATLFNQTWKNVHVCSCQLLYWPIFLQGSGSSSSSNVEYVHRAALRKHVMWSIVAIDFILGNIVGLALLVHADDVYFWVSQVACSITDNLLRSGCVWLMGVPAGFKLNTELARFLGLVSLNAIQIWSTLWFYMGFLFRCSLVGLAFSGMLLGIIIPAALFTDMLKFATLHITILNRFISFLYSQQIFALASLWRLFRGRKWNPLRLRLDSYDYTVEQHIIGSLLFTPILLLLPTTSVFYIFFTIMNSTISFICIIIEAAISVHYATPYAEIVLWIVKKRRFPSGVWFKITCDISPHPHSGEDSELSGSCTSHGDDSDGPGQTVVLLLQSNCANLAQIVSPHFKDLFPPSSGASSVYGILSGQRVPFVLGMRLPTSMPWMSIGLVEYWRLCRSSVLACRSNT